MKDDESRNFRGFCFVYFNNQHSILKAIELFDSNNNTKTRENEKMDLGEDYEKDVNGKVDRGDEETDSDHSNHIKDLKLHIIPKYFILYLYL